jgi:hypothetical protein
VASATQEAEIRRSWSEADPGKNRRPYLYERERQREIQTMYNKI